VGFLSQRGFPGAVPKSGICRTVDDALPPIVSQGWSVTEKTPYNVAMASATIVSEADILAKVVDPMKADLSAEAVRALLQLKFDQESTKRIRHLLRKNNRGAITAEERVTLEKYLRVGQLLDLLHAKARLSLQANGR
jgi:hypothetical protein